MSAPGCLLTEDQLLCSVCLDVFTDPVSTPCGHNFCKTCITHHWDVNVPAQCPNCNKVFSSRPELEVNTFISQMTATFRQCSSNERPDVQKMIQKRGAKVKELKRSMKWSQEAADREMAEGLEVFMALKECVERSQEQFMASITEKQRKTEERAEGFIRELEEEISELEKRSSEGKKLPVTKDWTQVSVPLPSYEGTVGRALAQLEEELHHQKKKLLEAELRKAQQCAVEVTLDPDTAHPTLILSDDGREVSCGDKKKKVPNSPLRFDQCPVALGKQRFSAGRFYFEVQVKGKTDWDLGVARESINRKGMVTLRPQNGYWTIWLRNENQYKAQAGPPVLLSLKHRPEKVGVFVDYHQGLVSFYDADTADLIYSFTGCDFVHRLCPYFSPGLGNKENSAPLIISPVTK